MDGAVISSGKVFGGLPVRCLPVPCGDKGKAMLLTVSEFRDRVKTNLGGLVAGLAEMTCRAAGTEEQDAWTASLPRFAQALSSTAVESLHLYFEGAGELSLEYPLPAASYW